MCSVFQFCIVRDCMESKGNNKSVCYIPSLTDSKLVLEKIKKT